MPARITVTVDGTEFDAINVQFCVGTSKDNTGTPRNQTLQTLAKVWVDAHDTKNLPFASVKKLFELANIPDESKQKDMKVSYWKDDKKDAAICTYSFKGWISDFQTYSPVEVAGDFNVGYQGNGNGGAEHYNTIVYMTLQPIVNKTNHQDITIGN